MCALMPSQTTESRSIRLGLILQFWAQKKHKKRSLGETQAAGFNLAAYMDSPAVVKAPLSSIFGSALLPLLDDDTVNTY